MKILYGSILLILTILLNTGCKGKDSSAKNQRTGNDTTSVADTGFTGIKQYMSGGHVAMETTFKNGVKEGLTKTYYASGKLRGTLWYENGLREDTSKWFFEEGQLFRTTPYKRDTVDGIQKQYFRNGKLKANIGYKKGCRTFEFEEFDMEGRRVGGYPDMVVNINDEYNSKGIYKISLGLSDKSTKVKYFRGDFGNGLFDSTKCEKIKAINGTGILDLRKKGTPQAGSVDVLAAIITFYGNNYLVHKKIELPYKDLN
jgi:antitoxin component YwqK of YwqJK toxin-antitoxin module